MFESIGWPDWGGYLGWICKVTEPGVKTWVGSCVTMIHWRGGKTPSFEMKTGYA